MFSFARMIASGLGSGYAPKAPGTVGSLVALLLGVPLMLGPIWALPLAILLAIGLGLWSIPRAGGTEDPGWVVIDEFAGQWIAMLALSRVALPGLIAAFALFRLFDITKPGPVGWADRRHGAVGVMLDDVIAGALAALALWGVNLLIPSFF